ncbi:MAG: hypothetical protein PHC66_00745 [Candidatus Nanoarchaeia archaeon]|nr:hypothetical protein [Candidatus Nanoarchaeia archaeon]MDD5239528.1 hypothetical protein [Candidatus Nanoarchaeia archaeon]
MPYTQIAEKAAKIVTYRIKDSGKLKVNLNNGGNEISILSGDLAGNSYDIFAKFKHSKDDKELLNKVPYSLKRYCIAPLVKILETNEKGKETATLFYNEQIDVKLEKPKGRIAKGSFTIDFLVDILK